jgi:hypothetical protein
MTAVQHECPVRRGNRVTLLQVGRRSQDCSELAGAAAPPIKWLSQPAVDRLRKPPRQLIGIIAKILEACVVHWSPPCGKVQDFL